MKTRYVLLALASIKLVGASFGAPPDARWILGDARLVGGIAPTVWGAPRLMPDGTLFFDGKRDGLMLPANPIAGWTAFTVAVHFRPESDAPAEQRFLCIEDRNEARLTMETRIVDGKAWCMDTFLLAGTDKRALQDRTKLHPLDKWAWAELAYDGRTMASYIDGVGELSGPVAFPPMGAGNTSVGVRLNRVFWFKGRIGEVRYYSRALGAAELPRESSSD